MPRCQYVHLAFATANLTRGPCSGDGSTQCWIEDVREFEIDGRRQYRCIFHAPPSIASPDWPAETRSSMCHAELQRLLEVWITHNIAEVASGRPASDFVLPRVRVKSIRIVDQEVLGGIILSGSRLHTFHLGDCGVAGSIDLRNVSISGLFSLQDTIVCGSVSLENCTVSGSVLLTGATIKKEFDVARASLNGRLIALEGAIGQLVIGYTDLKQESGFAWIALDSIDYRTHIGARIKFRHVEFTGSGLDENDEPRFWFRSADCSLLTFTSCNVSKLDFYEADLAGARFINCDWHGEDARNNYCKAQLHDTRVGSKSLDVTEGLQALYTQLKKIYEDAGDFRQAGEFHYREMEARHATAKLEGPSFERGILWAYGFFADFGESYKKLASWLLASFFVFGAFIMLIEGCTKGFKVSPWYTLPVTYLRDVGLTFLAIIPSAFRGAHEHRLHSLGWLSEAFLILETILAAALATLFVMAIRRRFRR